MDETETIILLIIIGVISTIFGKGKQRKVQGNLPTSFAEMRKLVNDQLENFQTQTQKITPVVQPVKKEKKEKRAGEFKKADEPMAATSFIPRTIETKAPQTMEPKKVEPEITALDEVDRNTLINGIIWSEILGEPRARKPYFPRKS